MKTHDLKTWPEPFAAILLGDKTHETRRNDRGYKVGDVLRLREWTPASGQYSGRVVNVRVTHMVQGQFGLPADLCVMSIVP